MHHDRNPGERQGPGNHRGPGRGGAFGSASGWAGNAFRVGKMFADGDLRLIVLALLESEPRHGYDIIKHLEERSSGVYSPSPGVVYPTLTFLEEAGYVSAATEGNRKVYTITDAGRAHLNQNRGLADMALRGMEKFGQKMSRARGWWEGNRGAEGGGDQDMPGASELNLARREIKAALADKLDAPAAEQERVARILREAVAAIRQSGSTATPEGGADRI